MTTGRDERDSLRPEQPCQAIDGAVDDEHHVIGSGSADQRVADDVLPKAEHPGDSATGTSADVVATERPASGGSPQRPGQTSTLEAAVEYARRGLAVIPLAPGAKIPLLADWPNAAATSTDQARALMTRHPGANIGIVLGRKSGGHFVVDVDKKNGKDGYASLDVLEAQLGTTLPRDMTQFTPSGGMHLWLRLPVEYRTGWRLENGNDKLGSGLDLKADGGQVVVEPSSIPEGHYAFEDGCGPLDGNDAPDAPPSLIELLLKSGWLRRDETSAPMPTLGAATQFARNVETLWPCTPFAVAELREALSYIGDWDDYDNWITVAMALQATNCAQAFELWVEWARRGQKFNRRRVGGKEVPADGLAIHAKHWKSLKRQPAPGQRRVEPSTIFWLAQQYGYPGRPSPEVEALRGPGEQSFAALTVTGQPPEANDAVFDEAKLAAAAEQVSAPALPTILLNPPGILNEIAAHIRDNFMVHTIPIFAVAGALAVVSIGMARIYRTQGLVYPNLYMILSGVSTGGKDAAPQAVRRILGDVGLSGRVASKPASGPGFFQQLVDSPASIFLIDEFGYVMEGITDKRAPAYKKAIYEEFLKAFTSANNPHYLGDALGRDKRLKKEDVLRVVSHPAPVILATTTPSTLWKNLSSADALSGLLGRCLVLEYEGKPPGKTMAETEAFDQDTPESIREWFRRIGTAAAECNYPPGFEPGNLVGIEPGSRIVPTDDASRALFDRFGREAEDIFNRAESKTAKTFAPGGIVWGRAKELAIRIAILCAGAANPDEPRITTAEAEWAIALTRYCLATMEFIANTTLFDSIAHKNKHVIYQAVLRSGSNGLSRSDVYNANASNPLKDMTKREKSDAIAELELGEVIEYRVVKRDRWGRVRREAWVATELLKWDGALEDEASAISRPGASRRRSGAR